MVLLHYMQEAAVLLNRAQHAAPGPRLFTAISLQFLFVLAGIFRDHGDNNTPQAFLNGCVCAAMLLCCSLKMLLAEVEWSCSSAHPHHKHPTVLEVPMAAGLESDHL